MNQSASTDYLKEVGQLVSELERIGLNPVLVGGMALVILGSTRVTQDFDFVISNPQEHLPEVIHIFYKHGLELVSRFDSKGLVKSTIDNQKVAEMRIRIDKPPSVYFFNTTTGLRVDLLFDFPIAAAELTQNASRNKISSYIIPVASESDLLRLKKIAKSKRTKPGDSEDLIFLQARKKNINF